MEEIINFVQSHPKEISQVVLAVIGLFTVIAKITENKWDNKVVNKIRKIADIFAVHTKSTKEKEEENK